MKGVSNKETKKRSLFIIAIFALLVALTIWLVIRCVAYPLVANAVRQHEIGECERLERQSRDFSDYLIVGEDGTPTQLFYITQWQSDMCEANGITLDARIQN